MAKLAAGSLSADKRDRHPLRLLIAGRAGDATRLVRVHNLSTSGMLIEAEPAMDQGEVFACELPMAGLCTGTVVWRSGTFSGCSFAQPITEAAVSAALLLGLKSLNDHETAEMPFQASPDFPDRLRQLRTGSGMSLEDVAGALGISKQTVWYWEKGRNLPSPQHLLALNRLFTASREQPDAPVKPTSIAKLFDKVRAEISAALGVDKACVEICIKA